MITNVEIKPNGNVYVTYGTGRTHIYFANQPLPQTVKNFMKTTTAHVVDHGRKTRIDIVKTDVGIQVYARREGERPVYITDECREVRKLFSMKPPPYREFIDGIDDISSWTPFENTDDYYNGIISNSVYNETIML